MIKFIPFLCALVLSVTVIGQEEHQSIHQIESEYYNALGNEPSFYENNESYTPQAQTKANGCTLTKMVYGWHPYWVGNSYTNYNWDALSHLSYFSYEVDPADGNPNTTNGWTTAAAVDAALANNTKVTLCVTLFGSTNLSNFLTNNTAKQNLITNLINTIQARGAHGVNIDFEGLPSSQKTNFANFMVDLSNQMHSAIPGSEVSSVLYAVDWNNVFDFNIMIPAVDYFVIMGYDYYYPGSSTAGPNDPLYHFGSTYNYTLSKTITNYVDAGCPKNKLVMGLPYYGFEWPTTSQTVPSSTTGNGVARTYAYVRNNTSGNYSTANHQFDNDSYTDIYTFSSGGNNKQCFISEESAFRKRLQHVNNTGIAGIGIWALGYDDGYSEFWTAINDFFTDCKADSCAGSIHDFGGPTKNYYNNEDYTWTIAPPGSSSIAVSFSTFDVELNYDTLWIYDGLTASSALIGAYTGTNSPGSFNTTTGAVTFRFKSDGATTAPGFNASYVCTVDATPPTTAVNLSNNWETADFTANFTDVDNQNIEDMFYLVSDFDGSKWKSNQQNGFLVDSFNTLSTDWSQQTGSWQIVSNQLYQADEAETNTNIYTSFNQTNTESYLYHWTGQINGAGTNRRAGIHFYCSDPTLSQRGDSYMVYWRADQDKCQIYKSTANTITLQTDDVITVDPNITYDFKILFNPITGNIKAFLDDVLVSEWTDSSPFTAGNAISLRTGNCIGIYDDFKVYKSRSNSEIISVSNVTNDVRYQNQNPLTPSANIQSINLDQAFNWSSIDNVYQNIDWTIPESLGTVADGIGSDINAFNTANEISGNWTVFADTNSDISAYWYAVGTSIGATDIVNWTDNGLATSFTQTGLTLVLNTTYYVSVKAVNGAGLESAVVTSNGQTLESGTLPPNASFTISNNITICTGEGVDFTNTSSNASSYIWDFGNGTISTDVNPTAYYTTNGFYTVTLTAIEGNTNDQTSQNVTINVVEKPIADFTTTSPAILPNSTIYFTNNSSNGSSLFWDFGDGNTSTDSNPWNNYVTEGSYNATLTVSNGICADSVLIQVVEVLDVTGIADKNELNIEIYPNPTTNNVTVDFGQSVKNAQIIITDLSGKKVFEKQNINDSATNLTLINMSSGVYFVSVLINEQSSVFKLIIE